MYIKYKCNIVLYSYLWLVKVNYWKEIFQRVSANETILLDYPEKRQAVVDALHYSRESLSKAEDVAVFGSTDPWLESILIALGVRRVTTFEFNRLTYEHQQIKTVQYNSTVDIIKAAQFSESNASDMLHSFDYAFSLSSFNHDGLGRYNEPVCADADLVSTRLVKRLLKPGGILFLSVPVGRDALIWNTLRVYGDVRLPLILKSFQVQKRFGSMPYQTVGGRISNPVFLLLPYSEEECH